MIKHVTTWNWYQLEAVEAYSSSMNIYDVYASCYNSRVNSKLARFHCCHSYFVYIRQSSVCVCDFFFSLSVTGSSSSLSVLRCCVVSVFFSLLSFHLSPRKSYFSHSPTQVRSKASILKILFTIYLFTLLFFSSLQLLCSFPSCSFGSSVCVCGSDGGGSCGGGGVGPNVGG